MPLQVLKKMIVRLRYTVHALPLGDRLSLYGAVQMQIQFVCTLTLPLRVFS